MPQNLSLFRSISCFGVIKIYSNLTSKIMKMCEQILKEQIKKRQLPNTMQILWIVKNIPAT